VNFLVRFVCTSSFFGHVFCSWCEIGYISDDTPVDVLNLALCVLMSHYDVLSSYHAACDVVDCDIVLKSFRINIEFNAHLSCHVAYVCGLC